MPLPQPEDFADRILALERAVKDLRTSLTTQGGFTSASKGLAFPDQDTPDPPASGGHLHASGDDPYWTDSSGSTTNLIPPPPEDPLQTSVSTLPGLTTPSSWPGTYTPSVGGLVQDDLQLHRDKINEIIDSLTR